MKVLLTVEFFWPNLGGAQEVVRQIALGLAELGHDVHVATSRDSRRQGNALPGVTIHEFGVSGNEVKGLRGEVESYRSFLRTFECDILLNYAAQSWATDIAMQEMSRLPAKRTVLAPCGYSGLSTVVRRAVYRRYFQRMPDRLRRYDWLIYHSDRFRDAEFGRKHGITNSLVISNGVDSGEFRGRRGTFREELGLKDKPLVVNVSNHYRLKGHDRYLDLAASLRSVATFALIGRDVAPRWQSCFGRCSRTTSRLGVHMVDGARASVVGALLDADLFVFTSRSEVAPIVLLEASAAGVPWISLDVGNARELSGGRVVNSSEELEREVTALLGSPPDRERLAEEGRRFAAQNSWRHKVKEYEDCFRELLQTATPVRVTTA